MSFAFDRRLVSPRCAACAGRLPPPAHRFARVVRGLVSHARRPRVHMRRAAKHLIGFAARALGRPGEPPQRALSTRPAGQLLSPWYHYI